MRSLKTLTLTLFLISAQPLFAAIYMKIEGIKGEVKAAGHEKWIEVGSVQHVDGAPVTAMLDQGRVRISSSSLAKLDSLCQSKRPLGDVILDIDGKRQVLRNARFAECPTARNGGTTAVFEFGIPPADFRGGVRVAAGDVNGDGATQANGRITGLAVDPMPIHLESLKLNPDGKSATVVLRKVGPGTLTLTGSGAVLPRVVIELTNGMKWTFTKVTFKDIVISSATERSGRPMESLALNFAQVEGFSSYDER